METFDLYPYETIQSMINICAKRFQLIKQITLIFAFTLFSILDVSAQLSSLESLEFRTVGPYRGGRSTAVHGDVNNASVFYMGTTGGGLWKTSDYGISWKNISDGYFDSPAVGAIAVSTQNSKLIYVGTGSDGLRSNIIPGKGMYKSKNGGASWEFIGLKETAHIGAVEIHPKNDEVVFVAAIGNAFGPNEERGIYKTNNGGKDWKQVLSISDTTGVADLEFHPSNPNVIYATAWRAERKPWTIISGGDENGIYKSTDGGNNWNKTGTGLPELMGKIDLAVSASQPDLLYALVEARDTLGGLYTSLDQGQTFTQVSNKHALLDRPFYYCNVEADPQNAEKVYVLATRFHVSSDGGENWKMVSTPHGDNHDMWISPIDSNLMVQSNDGGANISFNGAKTWTHQYNQPTSEIYQVEVDNQHPYWVYGGMQDNYTTLAIPSMPPRSHQLGGLGYMMDVGGCETGPAVPHPTNADIVYSNCKGRFSVYNKKSGQEKNYDVQAYFMYGHDTKELPQRFQRVSPIHISPHDPSVIYHCSQFVNMTTDEGKSWKKISPDLTAFEADKQMRSGSPITNDITGEEFYSTIYAIRESSITQGQLWVGANDGPIHLSQNGGKDWTDVTPQIPGGGRVDCVEPSHHKNGTAYVAVLRYQLGDSKPYLLKTTDFGKSWKNMTNGIPDDYPVRVVREDPEREGLLYAGTEYGLFISFDGGGNWRTFQNNLPITPITDIKVHQGDLVMSTMGRGFWILDNINMLRQGVEKDRGDHIFKPKDHYRFRTPRNSTSNPFSKERSYPQQTVSLDYFLQDSIDELKLDIMDAGGKVIRSFHNRTKAQDSIARDMATNFENSNFSDRLGTSAGFHRFKWDMKHKGAWDEKESKRWSRGPYVAPGEYFAKLTIGDKELTTGFVLHKDPRVEEVSLEEIIQQESLALKIVDHLSEVKRKANDIKVAMEESEGEEKTRLTEAYDLLVQKKGRYTKPQMISQINYLLGIVNRGDQLPGADVYMRFEELQAEYTAFCKALK